jgi:esterase/lipase
VIYEFADVLGRRLVAWGIVSTVAGVWLLATGDAFAQGVGAMFLGFGVVDAAIGAIARSAAERGRRRTIGNDAARARETIRIRRILLVNAALDVLYVTGGVWLGATAAGDAWRAGAGLGIIVQGAFLLVFDLVHARWVPAPGPLLPADIEVFTGPGHDPFRLTPVGPDPGPVAGALLVHGFGGSPRELRALAAVLASNGFVVEVPRLPGHGPDIRDIADYRLEDWLATVTAGAAHLREAGVRRLVVVGHSVGGALALATVTSVRPDALVLLAPFCWPTKAWQRAAGPLVRVFLPPGFAVFSRMDLAEPDVRAGMEALLPGLDLDDPAVIAGLRQLRMPTTALEQLFRVSHAAEAATAGVRVPVLAVQGRSDTVSVPARTRALLERLPAPAGYVEVEAAHDLVSEASPVRDEVLRLVLAFAQDAVQPLPGET